jgi:hypothetical protein
MVAVKLDEGIGQHVGKPPEELGLMLVRLSATTALSFAGGEDMRSEFVAWTADSTGWASGKRGEHHMRM